MNNKAYETGKGNEYRCENCGKIFICYKMAVRVPCPHCEVVVWLKGPKPRSKNGSANKD